jgi:phasin family protein
MYSDTVKQLSSRQRATAVDAAFECTTEVLTGIGQMIELNMQTVKTSLSEQKALIDAAWSARTPSELIDLQSRQFPAGVKKTFAYFRHVEEIAVYVGNGLFTTMHEHVGNYLRTFAEMVDFASAGVASQERLNEMSLLFTGRPAAVAGPVVFLDSSGNMLSSGGGAAGM